MRLISVDMHPHVSNQWINCWAWTDHTHWLCVWNYGRINTIKNVTQRFWSLWMLQNVGNWQHFMTVDEHCTLESTKINNVSAVFYMSCTNFWRVNILIAVKIFYHSYTVDALICSPAQYYSWSCTFLVEIFEICNWCALFVEQGVLNAVAPQTATNAEFTAALARAMWRPALFPMPSAALKLIYGSERASVITDGQKVVPKRTLESGYQFIYPDLLSACRQVSKLILFSESWTDLYPSALCRKCFIWYETLWNIAVSWSYFFNPDNNI